MIVDISTFHQKNLLKQGVFFSFSGQITQNLLTEMCEVLKQKMKLRHASPQVILKVFSMVVEQAQNIINYSADKTQSQVKDETHDLSTGSIAVGYDGGEYFVLCGNLILNATIPRLNQIFETLQGLTTEELKEYYKIQRKQGPDLLSKGAGLGFIEMTRKASRALEYEFEKVNEEFTFFTVSAHVQE